MNTSTAQVGNAATNGPTVKSVSTATEPTTPVTNEHANRTAAGQPDFADLLASLSDQIPNSDTNAPKVTDKNPDPSIEKISKTSTLDATDSDIPSGIDQVDFIQPKIVANDQSGPLITPRTGKLNTVDAPSSEHPLTEKEVLRAQVSEGTPTTAAPIVTTTRTPTMGLSERIASQHIQATQTTPATQNTSSPAMSGRSETSSRPLPTKGNSLVPASKPEETTGTAMLVKQRRTSETGARHSVQTPTATPHIKSATSDGSVSIETTQAPDVWQKTASIDGISASYDKQTSYTLATPSHMLQPSKELNAQPVSIKLDQPATLSIPATRPTLDMAPQGPISEENRTLPPQILQPATAAAASQTPIDLDHSQKPTIVVDANATRNVTPSQPAPVSSQSIAAQAAISPTSKTAPPSDTVQHPVTADQSKSSPSSAVAEIPVEAGAKSMTKPLAPQLLQPTIVGDVTAASVTAPSKLSPPSTVAAVPVEAGAKSMTKPLTPQLLRPSIASDVSATGAMTPSNPATVSSLSIEVQVAVSPTTKMTIPSDTIQNPVAADQSKLSPSPTVAESPAEAGAKSMTAPLAPQPVLQNTPSLLSGFESQVSSVTVSGTHEILNWDTTQSVSSPQNNSTHLRGELVPHVARQLVEVMTQATNRPVEIALSPHELGRVRMSIVADDNIITVNIVAERGETVDLMRRHIDQLGQTFRSMGYDQINFEFGQSAQGNDHTESDSPGEQADIESDSDQMADALTSEESTIIHLNDAPADGVDIRL
jgi:hypothetical protein